MKILRLNSISGPLGGVETYIENVNEILSEMGHAATTITISSGEHFNKNNSDVEIRITSNKFKRMLQDILTQENLLEVLQNVYNDFKPDIIHLHHFRIGFSTIKKFLLSNTTPVVFTAHDALAVCPLSTLVKPGRIICEGGVALRCGFTGCKIHSHLPYELMLSRSFRSLARMKIDALMCPSYSIMNYLKSNGFSPVVHLPSFSYFNHNLLDNEPDYEEILSRKNIGFIGRLEWYKGIDDLIKGFAIFTHNHPKFNLLIAGTGSYEKDLKALVGKIGIDNKITWLGKIDSKEREEFYKKIVCNVVPSKSWENFALSAQESLLRAVPTIGTNIGGIPEIVKQGITGELVEISSPEEIAMKLEKVINNRDNTTVRQMKNGRTFILNNLNPEKHIAGLISIYQKVLNKEPIDNGYDTNVTAEK
jgi:glycosyltransferase involved in cell wall biosynthesis